MDYENLFNDVFDIFLPATLASLCKTEREKKSMLKLGELCKKHNVSFRAYINILTDLSAWEAEQSDVRS